ncbi:hypothetical protein LZ30DRAFT_297225 [Colletotrichum cereale]|nr:hypothetical protein LZ30DRAFT_297225 [Colletotrichum cereale]
MVEVRMRQRRMGHFQLWTALLSAASSLRPVDWVEARWPVVDGCRPVHAFADVVQDGHWSISTPWLGSGYSIRSLSVVASTPWRHGPGSETF